MLLTGFSIPAFSSEPTSMIRQDRVWLCTSWERGEHTAKYMKFTDSKEFMDKTYTRVSTIKKVTWDYGMTNLRIEENIDETEAWMREENGKVYLLLDGWENYQDATSSTDLVEGLLYDFNAEKDSSFPGIAQYCSYEGRQGMYYQGWYHVSAVGSETVGDEEVKCWDVWFGQTKEGEREEPAKLYPVVEGIGIVEYGCLYYAETFDHTSGFNFYNDFCCYMDTDGNILYPKDYNEELPGGGLSSAPVVGMQTESIGYSGKMISAPGCLIEIFDLTGKKISSSMSQLSTTGISKGIYILKATGKNTSKTMKIDLH